MKIPMQCFILFYRLKSRTLVCMCVGKGLFFFEGVVFDGEAYFLEKGLDHMHTQNY